MSDEKPKAKPKVTAFELDPSVVGDVDTHPFTFGGFPGLWQVGRPIHPDALGLTVTRMRELVKEFNLPLLEVQVKEADAFYEFEVPASHVASGPDTLEPRQEQAPLLEVNGELIPGPIRGAVTPELQPFAAAQIARDTAAIEARNLVEVLDEMGINDSETRDLAEHDSTAGSV